jgi:hypothetical protein
MFKKIFLVAGLALPLMAAGTNDPGSTDSGQDAPPRLIIIRAQVNAQGEETNCSWVAVNHNKIVLNATAAEEVNKKMQGQQMLPVREETTGMPSEVEQLFRVQDMIAVDPIEALDGTNSTKASWHYWNNRFYGVGYPGYYGYRYPNWYNRANYGYYWRNRYYPYTYTNYYYPYGGYYYYYYYSPYYRWY